MQHPQKGLREIDVKAGLNACITAFVYMLIMRLYPGADNYINICVMTIAAVFITETDWKRTWTAGLTRCLIIGIGVLFGFGITLLDNIFQSDAAVCLLIGAGTVCLLVAEKYTGKMYAQCKLGSVSMILTVFTFRGEYYAAMGKTRAEYGIMFFVSTVLAAGICLGTMFLWDIFAARGKKKT